MLPAIVLLLFLGNIFAQDLAPNWVDQAAYVSGSAETVRDTQSINVSTIDLLAQRVQQSLELSDDNKAELNKRLSAARDSLKNEAEAKNVRSRLLAEIREAPATIQGLKQTLAKSNPESDLQLATTSLPELERKIAELEQLLTVTQQGLDSVDQQASGRAARFGEINKELADIEKLLNAKDAIDLEAAPLRIEIQKAESTARRRALEARSLLLKAESQHLRSLKEQRLLEHDLALRNLNTTSEQLRQLRTVRKTWRRHEASRSATQAHEFVQQAHPAIQFLAVRNAEIADQRVEAAEVVEKASAELTTLRKTLEQLETRQESLQSKVQHAPNATSTGILLRQQRAELPKLSVCQQRAAWLADVTPKAHLLRMELKEERRRVADPNSFAERTIDTTPELQTFDRAQAVQAISTLANNRRLLLGKLIADQDTLLSDLSEVEVANQDLMSQILSLRTYLDEHVLWVRSNEMLSFSDFQSASSAAVSLLDLSLWQKATESVVGETYRRPMVLFSVVALTLLAFLYRQRLARRLDKLCRPTRPLQKMPFGMSLQGLGITAILSAGWPAILLALGYKLITSADSDEYSIGLGQGFFAVAVFIWGCHFIRELCAEERVGHRMFSWPPSVLVSIRKTLELTVMFGAPLVALLFVSEHAPVAGHQSLHRITLITILGFVSFQSYLLLRPSSALMQSSRRLRPDSLVTKMQKPIWLAAIVAPLALAIVSISGYHYSAMILAGRFAESLLGILGLVLVHALVLRWIRLKSYNRRIQSVTGSVSDEESDDDTEDVRWEESVNDDILELLRYATLMSLLLGGWFIWAQVLPALGVLDRIALWDHFVEKSEVVTDPNGNQVVQHYEVNQPTTLMDGICALLVFVTTLVVVRRLVNLLEFTVLTRLAIDRGGRHAIAIMVNYVATFAGLIISCMILQLSWGNVQWLAAAMTVGLGFGLQEIFANLVSGLIILFERPIRAGDVITVGDITGTVSRMKMRATTILDFDRRELIVPNRKFITDNVVNWTLSDPICRTIVQVGVAYGSDTELVRDTLLSVAKRCPLVLDSPISTVGFSSFGDSTLQFELRAFIAHRESKPEVDNQLNMMINKAFAKENIEIAFPQRDLRIRSIADMAAIGAAPRKAA